MSFFELTGCILIGLGISALAFWLTDVFLDNIPTIIKTINTLTFLPRIGIFCCLLGATFLAFSLGKHKENF